MKQINELSAEFRRLVEKGQVWKESGLRQGRREVEVGTLLLGNDKSNVIADDVLSYFLVFKLQVWSIPCMFRD